MKYIKIFAVSLCIFFAAQTVFTQNNNILDASFAPTIENVEVASVSAIAKQADGKVIVGGLFLLANDRESSNLVRFNADGTLDDSFLSAVPAYSPGIKVIKVLNDGKILVGGFFTDDLSGEYKNIARLNSDGTFDRTFTGRTNGIVNALAVQPDGKIIIAGGFGTVNGQNRKGIARLNADGTTDTTFDYQAERMQAVLLQPDGKIVISEVVNNESGITVGKISRLNANGTPDSSFTAAILSVDNIFFTSLRQQPDGKILIGANFTAINNSLRTSLARLNSNGTIDETFNPVLTGNATESPSIRSIEIDGSGKILIGGNFQTVNGASRHNVARLNADGSTDSSFVNQTGANDTVETILTDADGKVFIGGTFRRYGGEQRYSIAKLNADGNPDASFAASVKSNGFIYDIEIQPDGKILAAGSFYYVDGKPFNSIVRFLPDGTLDPTFNVYKQTPSIHDLLGDIELQPDGKIIVVGTVYLPNQNNSFAVIRLNADGTLDNTFMPSVASGGSPLAVKVQTNGQIIIAGGFLQYAGVIRTGIVRLNAAVSVDDSFNVALTINAIPMIQDLSIRSDGKILIAGYFSAVNGTPKSNIALLNPDGTLDASFTTTVSSMITSVQQTSDGGFLIGGSFDSINGTPQIRLAKLKANGQLDATFNSNSPPDYPVTAIKPFNNGWIVLSGYYPPQIDVLNVDGSLKVRLQSYQLFNRLILDLEVQTDGKVIIGGAFTRVNDTLRFGLARLNGVESFARKTLFDYDGDGRADVSVFRPSNNVWYLNGSLNGFSAAQFGAAGDLIAPADFDGDGKTDVAVFRPSNGTWYRLNSSDNSFAAYGFGNAEDKPAPADYDGDGKADFAVFRPSNGTWYLQMSQTGFTAQRFGASEDVPTPGAFVR
jgi:uncharacterized delta-60 repeat protein